MVAVPSIFVFGCGGIVFAMLVGLLQAVGAFRVTTLNRKAVRTATALDVERLSLSPTSFASEIPQDVTGRVLILILVVLVALAVAQRVPSSDSPTSTSTPPPAPGDSNAANDSSPSTPTEAELEVRLPWFCACVRERTEGTGPDGEVMPDGVVDVTVCRPSQDECERLVARARRGSRALVGVAAECAGFEGDDVPALEIESGEMLEPSARAGGWQLRGRCAL